MTELDHLRDLLDEEGMTYLNHRGDITIGYYTDDPHSVIEAMDHSLQVTGLTAEQVMRALGHCNVGMYVGLRQGECWERTENSDYYCGGCGWKVTDHDSYCPECGGALHSCNCTDSERTTTVDETETLHARGDTWGTKEFDKKVIVHVMECSACGHTYEHVNGDYEFCPHCGRRIVRENE